MPELKYLITGDDRDLKRKLARLAKDIDKDLGSASSVLAVEINKSNKATEKAIDLINQEEKAYKKRNETAAKLPPPRRKVDFGDSAAEVAAYKSGQTGNIASGTVVGQAAALGAQANAATVASGAQAKLTAETVKTTVANKAQEASIQSLQLKLQSYKNIANSATDPIRREQYNRKIQETTEQITRMENVGKKGFDSLGNAITKTQNPIQKAIAGIFRMAYLLPGIGVAGILAFAIDPIINWISGLTRAEKAQKALNEAMQETVSLQAKASAETQIYITKLTNANIPLEKRQQLLNEFILQSPTILGALNLQNIATAEGKEILDQYVDSLRKKIRMQQNEKNFAESLQKEADLASGKLAEETDLGAVQKFIFEAGEILTFGSKKAFKKRVDEMNALRRAEAVKEQKVITKTYEDRLKADLNGQENYDKQLDSSLASLEKKLQTTSERLRNLQIGENPKALQQEKKQLEMQIAARKKLLGLDEKPKTASQLASAANQYNSALAKRLDLINSINAASKEATAKNLTEEDNELAASEAKYAKMREDIIEFNKWAENYNKTHVRKIAKVDVGQVDAIEANDRDAILDKQARAQYEQHQELLKQLRSYEQQRTDIQKKYAEDRATLTNTNDIAALDRLEQDELNQLDDANTQKLSAYQALFEGIEDLSNNAADVVIANAKDMLARLISEGKISADLAKSIAKQLETATNSRKNRLPEQLRQLAGDIQNVASAVSGIDEQFGRVLNTIGDIIGNAGLLKSSISDIGKANKKGDILGMLSGGLGAAGAVLGAVKSVVSLFDKSEERRARAAEQQKYAQDLQMKAINAQTQALQRQLDLIKDIYGAERIEKFGQSLLDLTAKESELTTSLSGRYKLTGDAGLDKILGKVNNGVGLNQIENQIFKAVKDLGIFVGKIDGLSLEELLGLADEGKLDEQTAAIVANIQTIQKQIKETENSLRADLTGNTFTGIADEIVEMFSRGNAAAEDFGKNFEEIMKRSILNSFKRNALEKQLQGFYEEFAEKAKSGGGLDENEIGGLQAMYDGIIANSQKQFKELEKATGISFKPDAASPQGNTLSGAVTGIRADQADLLAGQLGGLRIAQIETLNIGRQHLLLKKQSIDIAMAGIRHLQAIEVNTLRTANNTDSLKIDMAGINRQISSFINTMHANGRRI